MMKTEWKEFARDMENLEAEMEEMARSMPDSHVSCSRTSFTRNGKTVTRQHCTPQADSKSSSFSNTAEVAYLQEWLEMRMNRLIQQRTNMLYVLIGISMLLSLLALVVACIE